MSEKEKLLEDIEEVIEYKISFVVIKNVIISIFLVLFLLLPKIYIANHIYLESVKINKLLNTYFSLKAENSILKSKIEKLKFKNRFQG